MLAMLSIQIVLAPNQRPSNNAKYPGAAPVDITTPGFSFAMIQASLRASAIIESLFQRVASFTQ
jgi:hypothetical protein